jgi:transglutaminase-like putative cysteine protease
VKQSFSLPAVFTTIGLITSMTVGTFTVLSATGLVKLTSENIHYCSFFDEDKTFLYSVNVPHKQDVIYKGVIPTKEEDTIYEYTFIGWDKPLINIKQDTEFIAQYDANKKDYQATFLDHQGNPLFVDYVEAGTTPAFLGSTPIKPADDIYFYEFIGWNPTITPLYEDVIYTPLFEKRLVQHTVTFTNYDDSVLGTFSVPHNGTAKYTGSTPIRPSLDRFTYRFDGWNKSLYSITEDTTIQAIFKEEVLFYKVTFRNYNDAILFTDSVEYGGAAVYEGDTPIRPGDEDYLYVFTGWNRLLENIASDLEVYAVYDRFDSIFDIQFLNYDETLLDTQQVKYGSAAVYRGPKPERSSDAQYRYEFIGWDRKLDDVQYAFFTYAIYKSHKHIYEVTFANWDKTVLQEVSVEYGAEAVYSGPTPTKPNDDFYRYEFMGWSIKTTFVTKDLVTYAEFEAIPLLEIEGEDGSSGTGTGNGGQGDGSGSGGTGEGGGAPCKGLNCILTVAFKTWYGLELTADSVVSGGTAYYHKDDVPEPLRPDVNRPAINEYTYQFVSWDKELTNMQESFSTYAQYEAFDGIVWKYIVTFRNDNGDLLFEDYLDYGEVPKYFTSILPISGKYRKGAVFSGWNKPLVPATESYTVYADYRYPLPSSGGGATIGGDISIEGSEQEEKDVFDFLTTYKGTLYLRDRSYGSLNNNKWAEPSPYGLIPENGISPLYYTSNKLKRFGLNEESITLLYDREDGGKNEFAYSHLPNYPTTYAETPNSDAYASQFYDVNGSDFDYDFNPSYSFIPYNLTTNSFDQLAEIDYFPTYHGDEEILYREYAVDNYLDVSVSEETFIDRFISTNQLSGDSIEDLIEVRDFLASYATYNLKFERYPDQSSFVVHFLQTAREGTCNHFASALTLIYRQLNIPARYVTGYLATGNGLGTRSTVTTKQAHAWTEIYLPSLGWISMDATLAAEDGGNGEQPGNKNPFGPFDPASINPIFIEINPSQISKSYDGQAMEISGSYQGNLEAGDYLVYNIVDEASDIGTYVTRAYPRIYNQDGVDVSTNYKGRVKITNYQYLITPTEITIITASAEKDRDGLPLVNQQYEVVGELANGQRIIMVITGIQQSPGSSPNTINHVTFKIVDSRGKETTHNYKISFEYGTLRIK